MGTLVDNYDKTLIAIPATPATPVVCKKTKTLLINDMKLDATVIELDQREDGDEIQAELGKITGQRTVPNV